MHTQYPFTVCVYSKQGYAKTILFFNITTVYYVSCILLPFTGICSCWYYTMSCRLFTALIAPSLQVYLCPGLPPAQPHFNGMIFQYVTTPAASQGGVKRTRRSRRVPLARGGRYDSLLSEFRRPGKQSNQPNVSVVGVSIMWEGLMGGVLNAYQQGNASCTIEVLKMVYIHNIWIEKSMKNASLSIQVHVHVAPCSIMKRTVWEYS